MSETESRSSPSSLPKHEETPIPSIKCNFCDAKFLKRADLFEHYEKARICGRKAEKEILKSTGIPDKMLRINLTGMLKLF